MLSSTFHGDLQPPDLAVRMTLQLGGDHPTPSNQRVHDLARYCPNLPGQLSLIGLGRYVSRRAARMLIKLCTSNVWLAPGVLLISMSISEGVLLL